MDASSSVATESQLIEPSTSSDVKEERILARRKRIQAKIKADRRAALGEEPQKVAIFELVTGHLAYNYYYS